jgi:hypothetical protein
MSTALQLPLRGALENQEDRQRLQQLFDRIVVAARANGYRRSIGDCESCMYRGPYGARCLVGNVIPDDAYTPRMEGMTPRELQATGLAFVDFTDDMMDMLEEFQGIHDDEFGDDWESGFLGVAEGNDLVYTEPTGEAYAYIPDDDGSECDCRS